jgi:hypothetical protein
MNYKTGGDVGTLDRWDHSTKNDEKSRTKIRGSVSIPVYTPFRFIFIVELL